MNTRTLITVLMLVFTSTCAFSPNGISKNFPTHRGIQTKRQNSNPIVTYDASSTALTVKFPTANCGGKVEIYRYGAKVVSANAPAGATLCYMLRNYGRGNYTVMVSSGNTVVYSRSIMVK